MSKIIFLPQDYEAPKSNNYYMKLQDGENKLRILSQPILGWEDWHDKRPVRYRMNDKPAKPYDAKRPIKHFWAMIVWNYAEEQIQVLHVTQASIRNGITSLCNDKDWGAPYYYDIKIIKSGEGMETEYLVNPLPHKPLHDYIKQCFIERPCNLDAIFESADPFASGQAGYTEGVFTEPDFEIADDKLTPEQIKELEEVLLRCDPAYKAQLMATLLKTSKVKSLDAIPRELYDRILSAAKKKRDEFQAFNDQMFAEAR